MSNLSDQLIQGILASDVPLYFAGVAVIMVGGLILTAMTNPKRRRRRRRAGKPHKHSEAQAPYDSSDAPPFSPETPFDAPDKPRDAYVNLRDPKVQMQAISLAEFETQPLLNKEEYRLLPILEQITKDLGNGYRIIIQTTLGEVLCARAKTKEMQRLANASINSKRLDFAIVDSAGILKLAIEYQGSGHYQGQAFMRDAVKREALRKAGVHMLEVRKDYTAQQVKTEVLAHFPEIQDLQPAPVKPRRPLFSQRASG